MEYLGLILRWLAWSTLGVIMYIIFIGMMFIILSADSIANICKEKEDKYEGLSEWPGVCKEIWIEEMWQKRPSLNY